MTAKTIKTRSRLAATTAGAGLVLAAVLTGCDDTATTDDPAAPPVEEPGGVNDPGMPEDDGAGMEDDPANG